jgi:hypothetical protein
MSALDLTFYLPVVLEVPLGWRATLHDFKRLELTRIDRDKSPLLRCTPFLNGTAFCGMLKQATPDSPFGPGFAGDGPYYEAAEVDAEIARLNEIIAEMKQYA